MLDSYEGVLSILRFSSSCHSGVQSITIAKLIKISQVINQKVKLNIGRELNKTRPCNETKNIAKNYGKAIIAFIHNNRKIFRKICKECSTPYQRVTEELPELKATLSTVTGFRKIWTEYRYA